MREYKFRGLDINGNWLYGFYSRCEDDHYIEVPEVVMVDAEINETDNVLTKYPVIPKTVGQYTGLLDNQCVQIYEGDIVGWERESGYEDGQGTIEWDNDHCGFLISDDVCVFDSMYDFDDLEVIGNIHEEEEV